MPRTSFSFTDIVRLAGVVPKSKSTRHQGSIKHFDIREAKFEQTTADLGYAGILAILENTEISRDEIGAILFVSTTPDYRSPATACVLHGRLELSQDCISYDINLGSTGFVLGVQVGGAILRSINKKYVLVVSGDTTSKQLGTDDFENMNFGDGVSVVLLGKTSDANDIITIKTNSFSEDYQAYMIAGGGFRSKDGLTNYENDFLRIDHQQLINSALGNCSILLKDFLIDQEKTISEFDIVSLPPLGQEFSSKVASLMGYSDQSKVGMHPHFGDTRGAAIGLDIVWKKTKGSLKEKEVNVLGVSFGDGLSMGIISFLLKSDNIMRLIETDLVFEHGKIPRVI